MDWTRDGLELVCWMGHGPILGLAIVYRPLAQIGPEQPLRINTIVGPSKFLLGQANSFSFFQPDAQRGDTSAKFALIIIQTFNSRNSRSGTQNQKKNSTDLKIRS